VVPPVAPPAPAAPAAALPSAPPAPAGRALTQADLDANNAKLLEQIRAMLPGAAQPAPAPAAPPPVAPPPATAAPSAPPPAPATPPPVAPTQPGVDPLRQAAMETELRELKAREAQNTETLTRIQRERADAEARASFAQNQTAVRESLENNSTYRISATAAKEATDKMFYKNMIRRGDDGTLWVVLPDANGQPATYSLKDGVTKFLESPEGQFFRPATPPGLGTNPSTPGRAPVSLPGTPPASNSVPAASGIEGALTFQRALEQQQQIARQQGPQQ